MLTPRNLTFCSMFLAAVFSTGASAIEFSPTPLVFTSISNPQTLLITDNGAPVPAADISTVRLLIEGRDYSRMINVQRFDGGIRIHPTEFLEIGSYELEITVRGVRVICPAKATLVEEPDSMQNRVRREGKSETEIRSELGQFAVGHTTILIQLPEVHQVGRQIRIPIAAPDSAAYVWKVNGEKVEEGVGPHELVYTLRAPGHYVFEYRESRGDGAVAEARTETVAVEEPPVTLTAARGRSVTMTAPEGYQSYTWIADGVLVSEQRSFVYHTPADGEHRIECIASGNDAIRNEAFRKIVYIVAVR